MGWAPRWLRGLLGKKAGETKPAKEKKRWGFGKSFREKAPAAARPPTPPLQRPSATPRRGYAAPEDDGDDEQSKRAIAVAAATAAVAEAAVAAAQAAAAVVRLTSSGRCAPAAAKREEWAAVRIQAAFRGYLVSFSRNPLTLQLLLVFCGEYRKNPFLLCLKTSRKQLFTARKGCTSFPLKSSFFVS